MCWPHRKESCLTSCHRYWRQSSRNKAEVTTWQRCQSLGCENCWASCQTQIDTRDSWEWCHTSCWRAQLRNWLQVLGTARVCGLSKRDAMPLRLHVVCRKGSESQHQDWVQTLYDRRRRCWDRNSEKSCWWWNSTIRWWRKYSRGCASIVRRTQGETTAVKEESRLHWHVHWDELDWWVWCFYAKEVDNEEHDSLNANIETSVQMILLEEQRQGRAYIN